MGQWKWQRARFLPPTPDPEPFWVKVELPTQHVFPPLNDDMTGFDHSKAIEGLWYKTNVLEPNGRFTLWAPHNGVELLPEGTDKEVPEDDRLVLP